jgi:hypothetical protein
MEAQDGSLLWTTKLRIPTTTTNSKKHPTWRLQTPSLEMEQLHHKKHNFGYNSVETFTTYWSALVQDKQQYCADSTVHKHKAWRPGGKQLHTRFSIPVGTRSVGYFTKLVKPQFNEQKFEKSFTTWEFEIAQYERAPIPDNIKIAVLHNETKGALQQYLQL